MQDLRETYWLNFAGEKVLLNNKYRCNGTNIIRKLDTQYKYI